MKIIRGIETFVKIVAAIDGFLIAAMAAMICVDIILRVLGKGIPGSVEIVVSCVPVIAFLGVGYTMLNGQHIRMELFHSVVLDRIMNTICAVFIIIIGYYCWKSSMAAFASNQVTALVGIPKGPLMASTGFGMWLVSLALIANEIKFYLTRRMERKSKEDALPNIQ